MAAPQYKSPPLAGRPPWATDEDDSVYESAPAPRTVRQRQPAVDPNQGRESTYKAYDHYFDDNRVSGTGAVGMGLMNGDGDDSDDDDPRPPNSKNRALFEAATGPSKAPAPVQPLNVSRPPAAVAPPMKTPPVQMPAPDPAPPYDQTQMRQVKPGPDLRVMIPPNGPAPLRAPQAAFMPPPSPSPSLNPHPLQAPSTPITPVFARPSPATREKDVHFSESIMRGNSEETLLARKTDKGDDFWRRFSMVAKEENRKAPNARKSPWLKKAEGGGNRMSRWVWVIAIIILICIGGGIGAGLYFTRDSSPSAPVAVGGSANEGAVTSHASSSSSSFPFPRPTVTPSFTRAAREVARSPAPLQGRRTAFAARHHRKNRME